MPIGCMCHALLFLEQTAFMPCPQHYQEYLSFLLNVLKLKIKKQNQLIYSDLVILLVIFGIFNRFTDVLADELQAYHWCSRVFLGVVLSSHCCGTVGAAGAAILKQGAFVPLSALSLSGQPLC